jgi:hypothetical protein
MALTRAGTALRPTAVSETMSEALADVGNGGLESGPVAGGAHLEHLPTASAPISGPGQGLGTTVKPARDGAMTPQPPSASGAKLNPGPLIAIAQCQESLDADLHAEYQWSVSCEFYSLCSGVRSVCPTPYPNPFHLQAYPRSRRYNLTNLSFQSTHCAQNHNAFVAMSCATT